MSVSALMTLIDFTLSNARRFYSSMGNPSDTEGLTTPKTVPINPPVSVSALMRLRDFSLSNARRFYSSMGDPSDTEGLRRTIAPKLPIAQGMLGAEVEEAKS